MDEKVFRSLAICKVVEYFNKIKDPTDNAPKMHPSDVYIVWMCKALQNNKALLSTTIPDGKYYEVTFNGDKNEVYLDVYTKIHNEKFSVDIFNN